MTITEVKRPTLPRDCTFVPSDWEILSRYWYPVAYSHKVTEQPVAARLLDERLVIYRTSQGITVAKDICLHRGVPLSMGCMKGDELVCKYHGFHYDHTGHCTLVPAHPGASIPPKLTLQTFPAMEKYGLIWTSLSQEPEPSLIEMPEWDDPDYQQILPDSVDMNAAAGRQMEGFLDVAHFAWVHADTFGDPENPVVPRYEVEKRPNGFCMEYASSVSNFPKGFQDRAPKDFEWLRVFDAVFPFTARLTVHFPDNGRLVVLNAPSLVSARKLRLFVPIVRNFDKDLPLEPVYEFNATVFREDQELVEAQWPEDLPLDLVAEAHIRADKTSIAYRQGLKALGLGVSYTA